MCDASLPVLQTKYAIPYFRSDQTIDTIESSNIFWVRKRPSLEFLYHRRRRITKWQNLKTTRQIFKDSYDPWHNLFSLRMRNVRKIESGTSFFSELVKDLLNFFFGTSIVYLSQEPMRHGLLTFTKWHAVTSPRFICHWFHHSVLEQDGARKCLVNILNTTKQTQQPQKLLKEAVRRLPD